MLTLIEQNEMIKIAVKKKKVLSVCFSETVLLIFCYFFPHYDELCFRNEQNILNLELKCIVCTKSLTGARTSIRKAGEQSKVKKFRVRF